VVYPAGGPAFPKGRLEEYDVGDDSWVSVACGAVDRPFTDLEWATFGPSDEPKPTDLC
jgi:hypothetical protein